MKQRLLHIWRRINHRRHQSDLMALWLARRMSVLAIFPIFINLALWWFALALPCIVLGIPALTLMEHDVAAFRLIGGALYGLTSVYAVIILIAAAPWFFGWYFIAVGLMFGRSGMADQKEAGLVAAISANGVIRRAA